MPVRKIPKNHLTVTGAFASQKTDAMQAFESLLEKDYFLLLEFDDEVEDFDPQPVTIPLPGRARGYTPDVLVTFRDIHGKRPALIEVKHTTDLARNATKYAPKFAAATAFAEDRGWEFQIKTEVDIRSPRLEQLKFLRAYRDFAPLPSQIDHAVRLVSEHRDGLAVNTLLDSLANGDDERLEWLPIVWRSVLSGALTIDEGKISSSSRVFVRAK
jgi:hypothetical protein